jgi:V/A-type H+-transporting ATPase subunit E
VSKAASDTLEKVSGEFEVEAMAQLEAGRSESMAKVDSVRKETIEAVEKILETGTKQAESVRRQIIGAAELEARNAQLRAVERAVNQAFEGATTKISESSEASYERALSRLIQEGLEVIGPKAKVQCTTKDKKAVAALVRKVEKAKVTLDDEPLNSMGGVVLTTPDGSIKFDNTFEARLERMKPMLRKDIAAVLMG